MMVTYSSHTIKDALTRRTKYISSKDYTKQNDECLNFIYLCNRMPFTRIPLRNIWLWLQICIISFWSFSFVAASSFCGAFELLSAFAAIAFHCFNKILASPETEFFSFVMPRGEQKLFKILNKHEHTGLSLVRDGGSIYWLPESWPWLALGAGSKEHSTTPSVLIKIGMAAEKKTPWPSLFLGVKSSHPSWWGK